MLKKWLRDRYDNDTLQDIADEGVNFGGDLTRELSLFRKPLSLDCISCSEPIIAPATMCRECYHWYRSL